MKTIGVILMLFGWLSSVQGYGPNQIITLLLGAALYGGSLYLGKR